MKQLLNKLVTVHLGTVPGFTESIKGEIVEIGDEWITLKAKSSVELIKISTIKRISAKEA